MDPFQQLIVDLRNETINTVLNGLRNDPTPGWAQVARGLLNDNADILAESDDQVSQETLDILNKITEELKLTG